MSLSCMPCLGLRIILNSLCTICFWRLQVEIQCSFMGLCLWDFFFLMRTLPSTQRMKKSLILKKGRQKVTETLPYCKTMNLSVTRIYFQWTFYFCYFSSVTRSLTSFSTYKMSRSVSLTVHWVSEWYRFIYLSACIHS